MCDSRFRRGCAAALFAVLQVTATGVSASSLLVVNRSDDSLSVIAIDDGREVARIETGRAPHEVEVDASGTIAVVSNYGTEAAAGAGAERIALASDGRLWTTASRS